MSNVVVYGQDTLAVVNPKYDAKDAHIFFRGDSAFIQVITDTGYPNTPHAFYGWYRQGEIIREVRIDLIHSPILGIQQDGDTIYYYGYDDKGKNSEIVIAMSVGAGVAEMANTHGVEGNVMGAVDRNGRLSVISFSRKKKTFYLYDVQQKGASIVDQLTIPWRIDHITNDDIQMVGPSRDNVVSATLKVFLQNNVLGVVLDDPERNIDDPNSYRKTVVIRKNLETGKQELDGFRVNERGAYMSYLDGNLLYRLIPIENDWSVVVQDLDSNKVRYRLPLLSLSENVVYKKMPRKYQIKAIDKETLIKDRAFPVAVFLGLNDVANQKVLTVTFATADNRRPSLVSLPITAGRIPILIPRSMAIDNTMSEYLVGTPDAGFTQADQNTSFGRMLAEEHEIRNKDARIDYIQYLQGQKSIVGAYSLAWSHVIVFVAFPAGHD